jgi:xanthosine utilization system XapX-like protein
VAAEALYAPNQTLLTLAALGLVGWLILVALIWLWRLPRKPSPADATTELGTEPPAVVNLLTHRMFATRDAVPATLIDLAARGAIEIEDTGIGRYICRLKKDTPELTAYETRLLDHLRRHASEGVVPAGALTTGPHEQSTAWWRGFRREVVKDAQMRGLSTKLWTKSIAFVLALAGGVVFLIYELSVGFNDVDEVRGSGLLDFVSFGCWGGAALLIALVGSSQQTDTPDGKGVTARWLGVKKELDSSPSFDVTPPSGVIVWERHLAYAAAMGAAETAVRSLPMGAESDTEAWTSQTEEWRKVTVTYPRLRPGWGRHPVLALVLGLLGAIVGYKVMRFGLDTRLVSGTDPAWFTWARLIVAAIAGAIMIRSLVELLWCVPDLFARREVTGEVLRTRTRWSPGFAIGYNEPSLRYFVALDTGGSSTVRSFRIHEKHYGEVAQGLRYTFTVSPLLGYVADIRQVKG